jgi:hypothetical protein
VLKNQQKAMKLPKVTAMKVHGLAGPKASLEGTAKESASLAVGIAGERSC